MILSQKVKTHCTCTVNWLLTNKFVVQLICFHSARFYHFYSAGFLFEKVKLLEKDSKKFFKKEHQEGHLSKMHGHFL